jgi:3-oxoacyl-[acyl-carrier protein] reductase
MAQVAIVTGSAAGLGQHIAVALHKAGYNVAVTDIDERGAKIVADTLDPSGRTAFPFKLDISRKEDFESALSVILNKWQALHVVVNNAAITPIAPISKIMPEDFDKVLSVNQRGTFLGCQVLGAHLADAGYGRIVNMASLAGQNGGTAAGIHYSSSKAAIITMTKVFAREYASRGVTVNAIAPGPMDLPSVRALLSPERLAQVMDMIPVRRLGNPNFVAGIAVTLASAEADFVTGATWDINGGIFMR